MSFAFPATESRRSGILWLASKENSDADGREGERNESWPLVWSLEWLISISFATVCLADGR